MTRKEIESSLELQPLEVFGYNYAEFYHDGAKAISKLLKEKNGQVSGAFYKEGLGDIDVIWGDERIGLCKILKKHLQDFIVFGEGKEGIIEGISEIIEKGKVTEKNGVYTIWHEKNGENYLVGLSKGWDNKGENQWIVTSYKVVKK